MSLLHRNAMLLATLLLSPLVAPATPERSDWPQYNGPASDRVAAGKVAAWSGDAPALAWRVPTQRGFSSLVVAGATAYTLVERDVEGEAREVCLALDAADGSERWATPLAAAKYDGGGDAGADGNDGGDGPRSTPTVVGDRVLVYDARFQLSCLDARTGELRWRHAVEDEFGGRGLQWQNAMAPLVHDGRVYVAGGGAGQSLLAFDVADGALVWKTGDEKPTHATPVLAHLGGVAQVVFFLQSGLVACDAATGAELWRGEYPYRVSTAASPVVVGDLVYCSAGYGVGAGLFRVTHGAEGFAAELLWQKRNELMNHWSTPVAKDGHLYGMFSFKKYGEGPLACVDLETGEQRWSVDGFGPGNCILVGDTLVALSDAGELVLVEATPEEYRELARADVLDGKCWSSPAFADGDVFLRSTREAIRVDL